MVVLVGMLSLEPNVEEPTLENKSPLMKKKIRRGFRLGKQDKHLLIDTVRSQLKQEESDMLPFLSVLLFNFFNKIPFWDTIWSDTLVYVYLSVCGYISISNV